MEADPGAGLSFQGKTNQAANSLSYLEIKAPRIYRHGSPVNTENIPQILLELPDFIMSFKTKQSMGLEQHACRITRIQRRITRFQPQPTQQRNQ